MLLFDLNGTLTDPTAIGAPWQPQDIGRQVLALAVQTAMVDTILGESRPFADHIDSALRSVVHQRGLDEGRIGDAVSIAAGLPVFGDVAPALDTLLTSGHRLAVLTNSGAESGRRTLEAAGLQDQFERILGVDAVQKFKPHPDTYAHALRELGREPGQITFVSAHAWDLAGAHHAGMRTALVRRGDPLPPVFPAPDVQGDDLSDVAKRLPAPRR